MIHFVTHQVGDRGLKQRVERERNDHRNQYRRNQVKARQTDGDDYRQQLEGRCLIVDDEASIRNILKIMMEDFGFIVELAASGEEALEKILDSMELVRREDIVDDNC